MRVCQHFVSHIDFACDRLVRPSRIISPFLASWDNQVKKSDYQCHESRHHHWGSSTQSEMKAHFPALSEHRLQVPRRKRWRKARTTGQRFLNIFAVVECLITPSASCCFNENYALTDGLHRQRGVRVNITAGLLKSWNQPRHWQIVSKQRVLMGSFCQ